MKRKEETVRNRIRLMEEIKELSELEPSQQLKYAAQLLTKAMNEAGYYCNKKSR